MRKKIVKSFSKQTMPDTEAAQIGRDENALEREVVVTALMERLVRGSLEFRYERFFREARTRASSRGVSSAASPSSRWRQSNELNRGCHHKNF